MAEPTSNEAFGQVGSSHPWISHGDNAVCVVEIHALRPIPWDACGAVGRVTPDRLDDSEPGICVARAHTDLIVKNRAFRIESCTRSVCPAILIPDPRKASACEKLGAFGVEEEPCAHKSPTGLEHGRNLSKVVPRTVLGEVREQRARVHEVELLGLVRKAVRARGVGAAGTPRRHDIGNCESEIRMLYGDVVTTPFDHLREDVKSFIRPLWCKVAREREGKTTATAGDVEDSISWLKSSKLRTELQLITSRRFEVQPKRRDVLPKMSRWYLGLESIRY